MAIQQAEIRAFRAQLQAQLQDILSYWATYSPDPRDHGFHGEITDDNMPVWEAPKGSVLNARILWSFSKGYQALADPLYLTLAGRAYHYFLKHFRDPMYGGVYWSIPAPGGPDIKDSQGGHRKQIYAQAFWIYALCEYYQITCCPEALDIAKQLFTLIERYSYDCRKGGYIEAFARNWSALPDVRLSEKDLNTAKTMNTHLHILEAYMRLFQLWPDSRLRQQIRHLLHLFDTCMIDPVTGHLHLFFDVDWQVSGQTVSFGHDIEAAWLLLEAADITGDPDAVFRQKRHCTSLAVAARTGLDAATGGLNYEAQTPPQGGYILLQEKHWWVQAEAMVGFLEACLQTGDEQYYHYARNVWNYIQKYLLSQTGEWRWGIDSSGMPMTGYYKAGHWKCPYHNLRAMTESTKRLDALSLRQP